MGSKWMRLSRRCRNCCGYITQGLPSCLVMPAVPTDHSLDFIRSASAARAIELQLESRPTVVSMAEVGDKLVDLGSLVRPSCELAHLLEPSSGTSVVLGAGFGQLLHHQLGAPLAPPDIRRRHPAHRCKFHWPQSPARTSLTSTSSPPTTGPGFDAVLTTRW